MKFFDKMRPRWFLRPLWTGAFLLPALLFGGQALLLEEDFEEAGDGVPAGWILEGTGQAEVKAGGLHLQERPDGVGAVAWLEAEWPANVRLSFRVRFSNNRGIGVVFIAARAADGGDALRDAPPRTGAYDEYIRGELDSYSLSLHRYWPDGRNNPGSNLRRNSGFHLLSQALPDPCLEAEKTYHLEWTKRGNRLTVRVDGQTVHDAVDDGTHGPVLGGGKIGFRIRGDASCVMTLESVRIEALAETVE